MRGRRKTAPGRKKDLTRGRASSALLPLIIRNARDLIAFLDTGGRRIYNSPSYAPLLGDPEKLVGRDSFDDVHPEDRERIRKIFRETVRTGSGYRTEFRLLARDGTVHVLQSEGSAIRDEAGGVSGVVVVGRDVTEERRAAAQLDAALCRHKALADFCLFALREPSSMRVIERAAALVAELLNVDFGTVLELEPDGKAFRVVAGNNWPQHRLGARISAGPDTQSGHALELYRQSGANTLEAPQPVAIEDLRADGRFVNTFRVRELGVVSTVCVVIPDAEGPFGTLTAHSRTRRRFEPVEIEFMQAVANVLSAALERCRAHADLRESEAHFRSLAALSADWYWEQDAELRFSSVSEGFFQKSGILREEVLGKHRWELSDASPPGGSWDAHRALLEARLPFRDFEFARIGADGTEHFQTISGDPVFDAEGRFTGYRGTGRDITERRRTERELLAQAEGDRALIELGLLGLREHDPCALLESAVQVVARALGVELAKALELLPDSSGLKLVAGTGWTAGAVGHAIVGSGLDSQAGYTIREYELARQRGSERFAPVIVADLPNERRFSGSPLLREHGVVSGMSVVIPRTERPWGVLGVHSRTPRRFEQREAEFLQAAANLLSAALERCRAHAALQETEDRNRDLVEHCQDLICTHDLDGHLLSVNPWAAKCLGYERDEMLKMNLREFLAPAVRGEFDAYLARIRADGVASGLLLVQTRGGEKRVWEYHNTLRVEGVPVPVVRGMAHDISDRLRAEKALRESEERFRSLIELSSDFYWEQDAQFRFVRRIGMPRDVRVYPLAEVLGKTRWELPALNLGAEDWGRHRADLEAHREFHDLEIERPLSSGGTRWISTSGRPIFGADGRFCGYRGVGRDITERKLAERAIRENRRLLARAQEIAGLGYWEYDAAAKVFTGSRALRRMLGVPDDLPPQTPEWSLNIIHPDDRERVRAVMKRSVEEGSSYQLEMRVVIPAGEERIMLVSGEAVRDDAGRMTKVIGTCLDITEQRRREEELCDAADQLQALSRRLVESQEAERRRLAAELHDRVGQNLTALSINLHILAAKAAGFDAEARRRLRDSLALLDATALCIESVLDDLRPPMLDDWGIGPTLHWIADEFSRRTEIPARFRELGPGRRIDPQNEIALIRIVQEALNNVAKHAHAHKVEITLGWQEDAVRVEVADDGVGFAHTGSQGRTGLGMVTMRERVQAANGRLNIDSAPGKGTQVRALIPR